MCSCQKRPELLDSSAAGIIGGYQLSNMGMGKWTQILYKRNTL